MRGSITAWSTAIRRVNGAVRPNQDPKSRFKVYTCQECRDKATQMVPCRNCQKMTPRPRQQNMMTYCSSACQYPPCAGPHCSQRRPGDANCPGYQFLAHARRAHPKSVVPKHGSPLMFCKNCFKRFLDALVRCSGAFGHARDAARARVEARRGPEALGTPQEPPKSSWDTPRTTSASCI